MIPLELGIAMEVFGRSAHYHLTVCTEGGVVQAAGTGFTLTTSNKGRDLWHVVTAMRPWGDNGGARWSAGADAPQELRTRRAGTLAVCSHCGEPLDVRSVTAEPGRGAKKGDFDRVTGPSR